MRRDGGSTGRVVIASCRAGRPLSGTAFGFSGGGFPGTRIVSLQWRTRFGVREWCGVRRVGLDGRVDVVDARGIGYLVVNSNPTNCATTVCAKHTGVTPILCRNLRPKNRLAVAARIRGFPKCPRNVDNARLVRSLHGRTRHFNTSVHGNVTASTSLDGHPCHVAVSSRGIVRTRAMVVSANTATGCLNLRSRRGCTKVNMDTYTAYSNFFCHGGAMTMMNNNSATYRRTICLTKLTGRICLVMHGPFLHTSGVVRTHIVGRPGVGMLFRRGTINLCKRGNMRNIRLMGHRNRYGRRHCSLPVSKFFLTVNRGPGSSVFGSCLSASRMNCVVARTNAPHAGIPNIFTTNSITSPRCHRTVATTKDNYGTTVRTRECLSTGSLLWWGRAGPAAGAVARFLEGVTTT